MAFVGIDIGSTAMKAAAFDEEGRQLGLARLEYRKPIQGADDWWRAALRCLRQLLRTTPELAARVEGVGLSGRGGTRVLLDRGGRPISLPPGLSTSRESIARAVEIAGSRRGSHGLRLVASLLQLRSTHPREYAQAARAMVAKDYVLFQLTGHFVTDPASSLDQQSWPAGIGLAAEFAQIKFSEVRWPWQEAGRLRPAVAAQLGLAAGIPVATGAHDGAAATIGAGAARPGAHSVTLGTNTVYRIMSADGSPEQSRFWTVLPGVTAYGGDVTLGGYAVDWVVRLLGGSHDRLGAAAARVAAGCDGVIFLPQMNGRILPEANLDARASFSGIRRGTGREHLYRSVLEGNAFALRATREALLAQGLPAGDIYLTGGGTRSPLWRQILAGVFGTPVRWGGVEEGCRGGAIFAAVAAGAHRDVSTAMPAMTGRGHSLDPDATLMAYDEAYQRFLRVRDALDHV